MSKYLVFDVSDIQETKFTYEIEDEITVNSSLNYKCVDIINHSNNTYYMFNKGIVKYNYKAVTNTDKDGFIKQLNDTF